jgi:hypothetical protein
MDTGLLALRSDLVESHGFILPPLIVTASGGTDCRCGSRFCPVCEQRARYRQRSALKNRIGNRASHYISLTCAAHDCKIDELRSVMRAQMVGYARMMRFLGHHVRGHFCRAELARSTISEDATNAHIHALAELRDDAELPLEELARDFVPSLRSVLAEPTLDIMAWVNYALKASPECVVRDFGDPACVHRWTNALRGVPRFASAGSLRCTGKLRQRPQQSK